MTPRRLALLTSTVICLHASLGSAEPIFKANPYAGPIPQNSISVRAGLFSGAENQEMIDFLDVGVQQPFKAVFEDFGTGLSIEVGFIHKPHPRFGWRANASAAFLSYTSEGDFIPQVDADSLLPQLDYDRELKIQLFVLEASGVYYFADSSQDDLQTYVGAGFSMGLPHEEYTETFTDVETGQSYTDPIPGRTTDASEWDFSAGVHALFGVLYYITDRWGANVEARLQFMEGSFGELQAVNEDGEYEKVSFVIDYSGYYISLGATYGF